MKGKNVKEMKGEEKETKIYYFKRCFMIPSNEY
jgi:hypothetical protein